MQHKSGEFTSCLRGSVEGTCAAYMCAKRTHYNISAQCFYTFVLHTHCSSDATKWSGEENENCNNEEKAEEKRDKHKVQDSWRQNESICKQHQ